MFNKKETGLSNERISNEISYCRFLCYCYVAILIRLHKKKIKKMHQILKDKLKLDAIYTSFSTSNKSYNKKPNPGMLIKAKKKYKLNMDKCFLIGDRRGDILAADKLNCRSVFIDRKYREIKPITQLITVKSFPEAVKYIINKI